MHIKYKVVTGSYKTRPGHSNETTWVVGELVCAEDMLGKPRPCSNKVIHYYHSPLQAVFFSPLHGIASYPKLIEVMCSDELGSDGTKGWCSGAIMLREVELPQLTPEQRVTIAIRCALLVCDNAEFIRWAKRWLSGEDRSQESVRAEHWTARVEHWAAKAAYWVVPDPGDWATEIVQAAHLAVQAAYLVAGNIDIESILQEVANNAY